MVQQPEICHLARKKTQFHVIHVVELAMTAPAYIFCLSGKHRLACSELAGIYLLAAMPGSLRIALDANGCASTALLAGVFHDFQIYIQVLHNLLPSGSAA